MSKQKNLIEASQNVTFDTDGNVGIGTSSLDLVGSTTSLTLDHSGGNGQLSLKGNGTVYGRVFADNSTGDLKMGNPTSNDLMMYTANVERMRIDSAGRVTMPYQPSFYAFRTGSNYNASSSGWEKLLVNGTRWNEGSHFSTSNNRFTAPIAGVYHFSANVNRYGVSADLLFAVGIYVNGSVYAYGNRFHSRTGADLVASMSITAKLSANDYVEVWSYSNDSGTGFSQGANWNTFSGYLIG